MTISIITATYNSAAVIASCMDSVVEQDYPDIEYLIIDGGSTDTTVDQVKAYQHTYSFIKLVSEPDQGIYDALNKGISHATGDIIGFVHSDDFLASTAVIKNMASLFKHEGCDGVYGDLQYVNKTHTEHIIRYWKSCDFTPKLLKQGWMPAHPTLFLKREVYQNHGVFNLDYRIAADYDFILRIFKDSALQFQYLPEVITKMRMGGASNRSLKNVIKKTKEDYRAVTSNQIGGWPTIIIKNTSKMKQFLKK